MAGGIRVGGCGNSDGGGQTPVVQTYNGDEYCDEFGYCNIGLPPVRDDGIAYTYDGCFDSACVFPPALYGDVNDDEVVDLTDIL